MSYKPGDSPVIEFPVSGGTGGATNADSLPAGTFARNGTDDGTVTVTVTNVDTGRYKAAFTIPVGAAAGDTCTLAIAAIIGTIPAKQIVWQVVLDSKRLADTPNVTVTGNVTVGGYAAGLDPATLVLDTPAANHNIANSVGAKINTAGGLADPLANLVPGSYATGTAGYVIGLLAGGPVVQYVSFPVQSNLSVSVVRGDDYLAADGRGLRWQFGPTPDLTGATVELYVDGALLGALAIAGQGTANQSGILSLTSAQTGSLSVGAHTYTLRATYPSGHVVTLTGPNHPGFDVSAAP